MANATDLSYLDVNGTTIGYILMTVNILIIFPILIGNIFVLIAYKYTPMLRIPINLLLVNLALTDLCTGICSIPWTISVLYLELGLNKNKLVCLLGFVSRHVPLGVSCVTMLFIGIVRAISVFYPLKSRIWITHKRIVILMSMIWLYVIVIDGGSIFIAQNWSPNKPCHIKVVVHSAYSMLLGAHLLIVAVASTAFYISFIISIKKSTMESSPYAHRANMDLEVEHRATKMVMMTVFCFYVCWAPALIYIIIRIALFKDSAEPHWGNVFENFTLFISSCNSFMNPFIYAGYNKTFKSVFQRYLAIILCANKKASNNCNIPHSPEMANIT